MSTQGIFAPPFAVLGLASLLPLWDDTSLACSHHLKKQCSPPEAGFCNVVGFGLGFFWLLFVFKKVDVNAEGVSDKPETVTPCCDLGLPAPKSGMPFEILLPSSKEEMLYSSKDVKPSTNKIDFPPFCALYCFWAPAFTVTPRRKPPAAALRWTAIFLLLTGRAAQPGNRAEELMLTVGRER